MPLDAVPVFAGAAIFVGAAAYVLMRSKLDWGAWAVLSAGALPTAVYFTLRQGGNLGAVIQVAGGVGLAFAAFLVSLWMRWKTSGLLLRVSSLLLPARRSNATRETERRPLLPVQPSEVSPEAATIAADRVASPVAQRPPVSLGRRSLAYALFGFGIPACAASLFILRLLFLPSRNSPALMSFSAGSPPFQICCAGLVLGIGLIATGRWLLRPRAEKPTGQSTC